MKLAKSAAALAAALFLLSCPLFGQKEESRQHPLPPRGGQPEVVLGQPEPDAPAQTQPEPESDPVWSRDREPLRLELRDCRVRIDRLEARKGYRATVSPRRDQGVARVVRAPTLDQLVASLRKEGFVTDVDLVPLRAVLDQLHKELGDERAARQATDEEITKEILRLSRLIETWIAKNLPVVLFLGALAFGLVVAVLGAIALLGVAYRS